MIDSTDHAVAIALERLAKSVERIADAQERIADAIERQKTAVSPVSPTDADERAAIAAMCQMQAKSGTWTMKGVAEMIGVPRTTLNSRAKNWPTWQKFVNAQDPARVDMVKRGIISDNGVDAVDSRDELTNIESGDSFSSKFRPR